MRKEFVKSFSVGIVLILLICLSINGQHQISQENSEDVRPLAIGQILERQIVPQQKHRYRLNLEANQYVKVEIAEKACDVVISLRSPDDVNILEFQAVNSVNGVKTVWAAVSAEGIYELRIMSFGEIEGTGTYTVKIGEIRPATEQELNFTAGVKLFNETMRALTTAESIKVNIAKGNQALEKFRLAKAVKQEGFTLRQIANLSSKLGLNSRSIELFQTALEKFRSVEEKNGEGKALMDLGTLYSTTGEWEKAIQTLSEALKISRELDLEVAEADTLNKLGEIYAHFGDFDRAAIYYQRAAEIYLEFSNLSRSVPLNNLGKISRNNGDNEKASDYFQQAIEAIRKEKYRFGASKLQEAVYLNNLGRTQYALGNRDKAFQTFDESLKISRETANRFGEAATLRFLGQIYLESGETDKSLEYFNKSLEIYRAVEDTQNLAETLLLLSKLEARKENFEAAQTRAEEAITLIEKIRARVQIADLRDSFSANLKNFYDFYVELLMQRHKLEPAKNFAALALQANERARARGLLNLLAESNADLRQGVSPELLAKETELKNLLSVRLENFTKVLSSKAKTEETGKLKSEIEQIRVEYEQTQARIYKESPRYAALTQPKTLDLKEIQTEILDADSVLLEYALGDQKSHLWIVSKDAFQAVELPAKAEIEKAARQFYEALTARNRQVKFETSKERENRISEADLKMREFSKNLSRMLLAPAASRIANKRLLIVADGPLQYVPFASLAAQTSGNKNAKPATEGRFLIETNEIVNLPSASVLAVLRKETLGRQPAPKVLAVLADPIFDREDRRFQELADKNKSNRKPESKTEFVTIAKKQTRDVDFGTRDGLDLPRLPFTRREADLITSFVPENQKEKRLDFEANRQSAMSPGLSDFRFVHFATHGFINDQNPELSGIVFSMIDENGAEQDGFLRVGDIYNLKLPAEMVVLSGCRTGLGKEIKGEGLVGLTRGFMYAGARRVAVSLWDINDEATSELMLHFYREMLGEKKLAPASALRRAQIAMLRDKRWNNPYFWSTFTLQGEPK